jgi:MFS family permease
MTGSVKSHLLSPKSHALDDPSFGAPGLVARDLALDSELDREDIPSANANAANYGSIPDNIEAQTTTDEDGEDGDDSPTDLSPEQISIVIATLYIGSFLAALDTTIVTTLLSTIGSDINALSKSALIGTAYLLSSSAFQPLYGKVSDIFGRKSCLIFANSVFAIGCILTGFSHSLAGVAISRFITGIGGCGLNALSVITVSDLIPLRQRGIYQGYGNIAFGSGAALGGIFGALIDKYFGWEYAFFSQVPIALSSIVLLSRNLNLPKGSKGLGMKGSRWEKFKQVDFLGSSLLVTSLLSFMILLSFLGETIPVNGGKFWFLIIYSTVSIFLFGYVELYVAIQPIIPVRLLTNRTVLSSSLVNWFMSMSVFTYIYYMPIFWAAVLGLSPTQIGYRTISNFVGVSIGSFGSGLYMRKTGKYLTFSIFASAVTVIGTIINYFSSRTTPTWFQYIQLFLPGAGYAAILTVTLLALIASVSFEHQASTTAIQYAFRSTGSTIGISVAGLIFQDSLLKQLTEKLNSVDTPDFGRDQIKEVIKKAFDSSEYSKVAPEIFRESIIQSYDISAHRVLFFSIVTVILSFVAGLFIQEHHLHTTVNRK